MNPKQQAAIDAAKKRIDEQEAVPTQRTRTAAQGLTLGFGDEIEAALRNPFNAERRAKTLADIRGGISDYQEAYPYESLAFEVGGAALPALASFGATAPASAVVTGGRIASRLVPRLLSGPGLAPTVARAAVAGAGQGAAYELGTAEGDLFERAENVPTGALTGAAGGAVGSAVLTPILRGGGKLVDVARQRFGPTGGRAVSAEINRLAVGTGKSVDQLATDLISGRIIAENETLKDAVRAYARTVGGDAQAQMQEGLKNRAQTTFAEVKGAVRAGLSDEADDNIRRAVRRDDAVAKEAEDQAYAQFETGSVNPSVQQEVAKAIKRVPSAADDIQMALLAREAPPLFKMVDGSPVFSRPPTPMEAEIIRRSVTDSATAAYTRSAGALGKEFNRAEDRLRQQLDTNIPELGRVRADAALLRAGREAFDAGQKAIRSGADQVQIDFADLNSSEAISAYRAGFMDELRKRFRGQQPASVVAQLASDEKNLGQILRAVFPEDSLDDVVRKLDIAEQGQNIKSYALGQSATAPTQAAADLAGSSLNPSVISAVFSLNPLELAKALGKFLPTRNTGLTDAQNTAVVKVLLSENPDFVRRAMADESTWGLIDRAATEVANRLARGGARATAVGTTAGLPGLLSQD